MQLALMKSGKMLRSDGLKNREEYRTVLRAIFQVTLAQEVAAIRDAQLHYLGLTLYSERGQAV